MTDAQPSATARLFVAAWPDVTVRERLVAERDRWRWTAAASVVPIGRLHLTLHFLGPVDRGRLPELVDGLRVTVAAFTLRLDRPALWPNGIAVLAPSASAPELAALQAALGGALERLRIPMESRAYRPHVTLARHATGSVGPTDATDIDWVVDRYALVESNPGPDGGYTPLRFFR